MDEITLVIPQIKYAEQIMAFRQEMLADREGFEGCCGLENFGTAEDWLKNVALFSDEESCPAGRIPSDVFLGVRTGDDHLVGIIDLRRHINHPILSTWGGHIGYSVRKSERRKGYATQMLRLCIQQAKSRNIERLLVTCSASNPASRKVIEANGGVFESEVLVDGNIILRHWIDLSGDR